jgi:hypothetical protein
MGNKMPSKSFKNSNPGNIRYGKWAASHGAVDSDGFGKWATAIEGTAALLSLLAGSSYRNLDLTGVFQRYAPASDNNRPREYAAYVAQRAGVPLDMMLADMDPFQVLKVAEGITRFEGWKA